MLTIWADAINTESVAGDRRGTVTLNPERDSVVNAHAAHPRIEALAA